MNTSNTGSRTQLTTCNTRFNCTTVARGIRTPTVAPRAISPCVLNNLGSGGGREHWSGLVGALTDQVGYWRQATGAGEVVLEEVEHVQAEQLGGADEGMEDIPGADTGGTPGAEADIALADATPGRPFGGIVGQRQVRFVPHPE